MPASATKTVKSIGMKDAALFRQQVYIDGKWSDADSGETTEITNPSTGEVLGTVPNCGAAEAKRAIEAANAAWPMWRSKTAKERAVIMRRWYELMMENQEDLARLMTAEQGKPLSESRGEISYAASFIEWFGEEGKRLYGDTIPAHASDKRLRNHAAYWSYRCHHSLEFSGSHDNTESRASTCCRMSNGHQTGTGYTFFRVCAL